MFTFILIASRIVVGVLFLVAGTLKLRAGYKWFYQTIQSYRLTSHYATKLLAFVLLCLEVILGICLVFNLFLPWSVIVAYLLLLLFTLAIAVTHIQGKQVDCGCFGKRKLTPKEVSKRTIVSRNIVMSGILLLNLTLTRNEMDGIFPSNLSVLILFGVWLVSNGFSIWAIWHSQAEKQSLSAI